MDATSSTQPPLARRSSFQAHQDILAADAGRDPNDSAAQQAKDSNEPIVKATDMPEGMQQHAIQATQKAMIQAKEEGQLTSDILAATQQRTGELGVVDSISDDWLLLLL